MTVGITPDYAASVDFLKKFHPGRRWVLTGIHPDANFKPRTVTATFDDKNTEKCLIWLADKGQTYNLYFSVNECKGFMLKKAERSDIARMWYIHVDIDPNAGEPVEAEQRRILELLTNQTRLPPASIITFSGGGYQGFWALDNPIDISGDEAKYEDAKLYNLAVEVSLGADNCHNVDRVMRLPGSINRPDAKKIAKGRIEALATVVQFNDIKYGLDRFSKSAPPKPNASSVGGLDLGSTKRVKKDAGERYVPPANVQRIGSLDELTLPDWVKVLINVGYDANNPNVLITKKYPSRSEALFAVVCQMVKAKMDSDTIFSILTDSRFGMSAAVLDKGSSAVRYAERQINRAREETIHPWLSRLNERFAVIASISGKCRVVEEQNDEGMDRTRLVKQSFDDFMNRFMNIPVQIGNDDKGKPINKPLGQWWLMQPHRRQYDKIVFSPGVDVSESYNLWRGFGCEAIQGKCDLFLNHIRKVVCSGNEEHYNYLVGWMASAVQIPNRPAGTAVILKGDQGTGKGVFVKAFGSLFGRHFMQVADPKHLVGNFNSHLRDCVVLFADEAFFAGDKKHENILKMLVTEETLTIEAKGIDAESAQNCVHLLMASNDHWVVPAGVGDRRFFVLHVSNCHKEDVKYFGDMDAEWKNGGQEALLYYLMTYDLKGFEIRKMPKTEELQQQKVFSLATEETWLREKLADGRLLPEQGSWVREIPEGDLFYDYQAFCRQSNAYRRANKTALRSILGKYIPNIVRYMAEGSATIMQPDGQMKMVERPSMLRFPPLDECRALWEKHFGGKTEWESTAPPADQYGIFKDGQL